MCGFLSLSYFFSAVSHEPKPVRPSLVLCTAPCSPLIAMAGTLMDKAIQALGKKPLYLRPLEEAKCGIVEVEEPITCIGFTTDACRPLQKGVKSITVLFDFHNDIPSCGEPVDIGQIAMQYRWDDLPEPIRFKGTPPSTTKMDFVHVTMANGNVDVLKVLYLPRPMSFQAAEALCSGKAYIPVFRSGPWNTKRECSGFSIIWEGINLDGLPLKRRPRRSIPQNLPGHHQGLSWKKASTISMHLPQNVTLSTSKHCGSCSTSSLTQAHLVQDGRRRRYGKCAKTKARGLEVL